MRLKDKVMVITGGGSGIGRGTAVVCAREGAQVIITGRRKEKLEETAAEIARENGSVLWIPMDISREEDVKGLFEEVYRKFGKIDVLYNNAGIFNTCGRKVADVIEMLTKNIAIDYGPDHIRCNTVCPGYVEIEFNREQFAGQYGKIASLHPAGRPGFPEDLAYGVVYLASDESLWVTGASFMIDGGYTCGTPAL